MIGLALCPWAKPVHERGGVKIIHTGAKCPSELFGRVLEEMDLLAGGDAETSILVAPGVSAFRDSFPASMISCRMSKNICARRASTKSSKR